jgi:hypothetical protein
MQCAWQIPDEATYNHFKQLITQNENWNCRVAMAPNVKFYIPFSIPVWGVVEPDHIHIDTHLNFIFHGDPYGRIIGAAAYSVQDSFQPVVPGFLVRIHGCT